MLPIFLAWIQSSIVVQVPPVVQPSMGIQSPTPQSTPVNKTSSITISQIIKPVYLRPIKPFKTVENIPFFKAMTLQDGGNTIVTGLIENGELKLNFINALSEKSDTGYTSSIIQLNDPSFKDANQEYFLPTKIYINKENMFVYFLTSSNHNLVRINTKNKLQYLSFSPLECKSSGCDLIQPVSNGELFNEFRNNNQSANYGIWEIMDNGSIKKQKSFSDSFLSILSSDRKSIFRWIPSSSPYYEVSVLNLDKKTEQRIPMLLNNVTSDMFVGSNATASRYDTNLFSVRRGEEEYLIIQASDHSARSIDVSKISFALPYFYQSNALETAGRGSTRYANPVYVWNMTQKKFKYFLPSQGRIEQLAIAPDGRTLVISEAGGDRIDPNKRYSLSRITVWDLPTGQLLREVDIDRYSVSLAFTPDSKTLITGAQGRVAMIEPMNAQISVWNVEELRNP